MQIKHKIRTSYGRSRTNRPGLVAILATPSEVHQLIRVLERQAADADADGHHHAAEVLFTRAIALRETARC